MSLAARIAETQVPAGQIALFYLAQAGFCLKTSRGTQVYVDPYLTDCCERLFGFKRMIPPVLAPQDITSGILACTHAHADHLDPDALPTIAQAPGMTFVGARDCGEAFAQAGLPASRYTTLTPGQECTVNDVTLRAVYADHGDLAPEAVGLVIMAEGLTVYNTGDTALRPSRMLPWLRTPVDILIAPINGRFGNLDAREACQLAVRVKPKLLIASHFWMFVEHNGDPASFLAEARSLPQSVEAMVMAPGEMVRYAAGQGLVERRTLGQQTKRALGRELEESGAGGDESPA